MAPGEPRPTFLIIGAQKSATRWLRHNLGLHPEVFASSHEIGFFNRSPRFRSGAAWYAAHFDGWEGEPIVGEATPGYMIWRHDPVLVARRIQKFDPNMKLIAILRNPVDRAYSGFVHHMRTGRIAADADVLEYVRSRAPESDRLNLIAAGWYAANLRPFHKRFGEQLLTLVHDDLADDPPALYARTLEHIGAEPGFVPPRLDQVRFNNAAPSQSELKVADGNGYRPLTMDQRAELFEYFRKDVVKLEQMLGCDLSIWNPDPPPLGELGQDRARLARRRTTRIARRPAPTTGRGIRASIRPTVDAVRSARIREVLARATSSLRPFS